MSNPIDLNDSSKRYFKSDNYAGIHPNLLAKITAVNIGHESSYGADKYTKYAELCFQEVFNREFRVAFTLNGTGTNVLALKIALKPHESVISANTAHINTNETGAPESVVGCKILTINTENGKITAEQIKAKYIEATAFGRHATHPKLVSITQCTEFGTVYDLLELKQIRKVCDELNLLLHIDGCRIYNAASFLNVDLDQIAVFADFLSLGGTKLGAIMAESLLVFNPGFFDGLEYVHKNTLQLNSKNRFVASQYLGLFENNAQNKPLWLELAEHENKLAHLIGQELSNLGFKIIQKVESNHIFVEVGEKIAKLLESSGYCYIWTQNPFVVRFVVSFDNTESDVGDLITFIKNNI